MPGTGLIFSARTWCVPSVPNVADVADVTPVTAVSPGGCKVGDGVSPLPAVALASLDVVCPRCSSAVRKWCVPSVLSPRVLPTAWSGRAERDGSTTCECFVAAGFGTGDGVSPGCGSRWSLRYCDPGTRMPGCPAEFHRTEAVCPPCSACLKWCVPAVHRCSVTPGCPAEFQRTKVVCPQRARKWCVPSVPESGVSPACLPSVPNVADVGDVTPVTPVIPVTDVTPGGATPKWCVPAVQ